VNKFTPIKQHVKDNNIMPELEYYVTWYPSLIDLTYQVIQSLKGVPTDWRLIRCHDLASKVFLHAATINSLKNGTNL